MRALLARHTCCRLVVPALRHPTHLIVYPATQWRSQILLPLNRQCRRAFWGIFQESPREIKPMPTEPGWGMTVLWRTSVYENVRPPPREDLISGFRMFFEYKTKHDVPVNSTQALYLGLLLNYLLEDAAREGGGCLNRHDLEKARNSLLVGSPDEDPHYHLEFLRALHVAITDMCREGVVDEHINASSFCHYLKGLTQLGASVEAASALTDYWERLDEADRAKVFNRDMWLQVLRGLAKEGREEELTKHRESAEAAGMDFDPWYHEVMTVFYTDRVTRTDRPSSHDIFNAKYWFEKQINNTLKIPTSKTLHEILQFSLKTDKVKWVTPTFEALKEKASMGPALDVVLQWVVFGIRMGRPEVEGLIKKLARDRAAIDKGGEGHSEQWPTNNTFNGLLEMAIERDEEDLAKQAMAMAEAREIAPNTRTYILLANWMLDKKRPGYAFETYRELRNSRPTNELFEAAPVADRLLRVLCQVDPPEFDKIGEISADLERQGLTLSAETVVALCMAYLRFERNYDVLDTLSLNVFQFSIAHREKISRAFIDYCLVYEKSTARIWDAWQILTQFFPALDLSSGRALMRTFFSRKRPDMAVRVFQHMAKQLDTEMHPDTDAYAEFFTLLGHCPDENALTAVHNMLKLDPTIQWSTKLFNSLMIAYGPSEKPSKALDYWEDITQSIEGPSYASLDIVFWACAHKWDGHVDARKIWRKLIAREVDVTPMLYVRYVAAIAHSKHHLQEALSLLDYMPEAVGHAVDTMTLGIVYNALPGLEIQQAFETWARARHLTNWEALEKQGRRLVPGLLTKFKIYDRVDAGGASALVIPGSPIQARFPASKAAPETKLMLRALRKS